MSELVSIIIPVYNRKKIFLCALASAYAQDYPYIEVIVVDDGSTELNIEDIELESQKNIRIKKIRQKNRGAQAARNRGAEESKGDYILFWDADVVAQTSFVSELYYALKDNPGAGYAYCNFFWGRKKMKSRHFDPDLLVQENYIHISSLIRKRVLVPLDEHIKKFQDWDLWLTLLEKNITGVWVNRYLYKAHPGGTISTWLPRFAYKKPWRKIPFVRRKVEAYDKGKEIIFRKHGLI